MEKSPAQPHAVEYCRQARRLRARLADRPLQLHQALRRLARSSGVGHCLPEIAEEIPTEIDEPARITFVRAVLDRLEGPFLRYSLRVELLQLAARLGISRFDANLIIAQVQHRASGGGGRRRALRCDGSILPFATARALPYVLAGAVQASLILAVRKLMAG